MVEKVFDVEISIAGDDAAGKIVLCRWSGSKKYCRNPQAADMFA